jgi:hypothetical protein
VKRIRRETARVARQMSDDMDEPSIRTCYLTLWPPIPIFPDCEECLQEAHMCGECCVGYPVVHRVDLNDDYDATIDEPCECYPGVQACVSTPLMPLPLDEIDGDGDGFLGCEECNPGTCTFECGTGVQALSASDADWILDKHEPYEIDDEFPS